MRYANVLSLRIISQHFVSIPFPNAKGTSGKQKQLIGGSDAQK